MLMFIQMESFYTDSDELIGFGTTGTFPISRMHTAPASNKWA
jgi:hypothetical protein